MGYHRARLYDAVRSTETQGLSPLFRRIKKKSILVLLLLLFFVPTESTCEGDIPGIQVKNACCPLSCGECGGAGCTRRDGGKDYSGREACCGFGVLSMGRVCSDTVGAPCTIGEGGSYTGSAGATAAVDVADLCVRVAITERLSCGLERTTNLHLQRKTDAARNTHRERVPACKIFVHSVDLFFLPRS